MSGVEWGEGGGFAALPHWLVTADVSDRAIRLWAVLARYADYKTGEAYPSRTRMAEDLRCSTSAVDRSLTELLEVGAVTRRRRWTEDGEPMPSMYTLQRVEPTVRAATAAVEAMSAVEPAASEVAPSVGAAGGRVRDLMEGLVGDGGVLDAYLSSDYRGDPLSAYRRALLDARALAREFPDVSKDPERYLTNAVVARAALDYFSVDQSGAARLNREAKALGADGHDWLLLAMAQTSSAPIKGDPISYVIATARRARAAAVSSAA